MEAREAVSTRNEIIAGFLEDLEADVSDILLSESGLKSLVLQLDLEGKSYALIIVSLTFKMVPT